MQEQYSFRQITALDFGRVPLGPVQLPALRPKPIARSWRSSSGPTLALFGRGTADFLDEQRAEAALGVVACHPGQTAVHDMLNAVDGHRRFSDIGGDDDFTQRIRLKRQVLSIRRQITMERNQREPLARPARANGADGRVDFRHAGHEDEEVARLARVDDALDDVGRLLRDWPFVFAVQVMDFDRKAPAFGK